MRELDSTHDSIPASPGSKRQPDVNENDWDVQAPVQPLKRLISMEDIEDRRCECVQVDVDEWDARSCLLHGPNSVAFRKQKKRETADLIAYYSGPDPFEEPVRSGSDTHRPAEAFEENKQRRTTKGERKMKEVLRFAVDTPVEV